MKDMKNTIDHLKNHQDYPATKEELVEACNSLSDFSDEDKKWYQQHLEHKTYNSAEEVMETLGINRQAGKMM